VNDWQTEDEHVSCLQTGYIRFPDSNFPGWSFSRKDVSRMVFFLDETLPERRFPDCHFPGKRISGKMTIRKSYYAGNDCKPFQTFQTLTVETYDLGQSQQEFITRRFKINSP